jgi:opacity protein-like surface antigen
VGVAFCLAIPARAQAVAPGAEGFYIGGEGGWTDLLAATNTGDGAVALERFQAGFDAGGRAGYQEGPWRFEGEIDYRQNDTQHLQMLSPANRPGRAAGAERHAVSEMANVIYDIDLGWPVTPHVGGGVGAAEVTRNLSNQFGGTHDTATVFAYQFLGGLRYWINPALALDLDYRYFATTSTTFISTNPDTINSDYQTHNVVVSLTWLFGGSPLP